MPVVREVFMILVMTGTRTSRYCLVKGVGTRSRLQLLTQFSKSAEACLLLSQGSKPQNFEPVNGPKTGGSAD